MKVQIDSKRQYSVETSVNGIIENSTIDFSEIIDSKSIAETIYSMQEIIDEILDLKIKESIYFQPNRDDSKSKGIITRMR